jgi:hypothetical protein
VAREPTIPITPYLDGIRLDPETRRVTGIAFEIACIALRLTEFDDRFKSLIAGKIIELAKAGERNADRLSERALLDLRGSWWTAGAGKHSRK